MATLIEIYSLQANDTFAARIAAAVAKGATDILNEDPATPSHAERLVWAKHALENAEDVAAQMLWAVVQNATIQTSGLDSTDNDIIFVVNSNINNFI